MFGLLLSVSRQGEIPPNSVVFRYQHRSERAKTQHILEKVFALCLRIKENHRRKLNRTSYTPEQGNQPYNCHDNISTASCCSSQNTYLPVAEVGRGLLYPICILCLRYLKTKSGHLPSSKCNEQNSP